MSDTTDPASTHANHIAFLVREAFKASREAQDMTPSDFLLDLRQKFVDEGVTDQEQAQRIANCEAAIELLTITKPLERGHITLTR